MKVNILYHRTRTDHYVRGRWGPARNHKYTPFHMVSFIRNELFSVIIHQWNGCWKALQQIILFKCFQYSRTEELHCYRHSEFHPTLIILSLTYFCEDRCSFCKGCRWSFVWSQLSLILPAVRYYMKIYSFVWIKYILVFYYTHKIKFL